MDEGYNRDSDDKSETDFEGTIQSVYGSEEHDTASDKSHLGEDCFPKSDPSLVRIESEKPISLVPGVGSEYIDSIMEAIEKENVVVDSKDLDNRMQTMKGSCEVYAKESSNEEELYNKLRTDWDTHSDVGSVRSSLGSQISVRY